MKNKLSIGGLMWIACMCCAQVQAQVTIQQLYEYHEQHHLKDSLFYAYYEENDPINWPDFFHASKELIAEDKTYASFLLTVVTFIINQNPTESRIVLDHTYEVINSIEDNRLLLVQHHGYLSYLLAYKGDFRESLKLLQTSLALLDPQTDTEFYAGTLADLANVYNEFGDLTAAKKYFRLSNEAYQMVNDETNLLVNTFNLGGTYMNAEEYDSAILLFEQVKAKAPDIYPILEAFCYGNIGQSLGYKGDFRGAVDSQLTGLRLEQQYGQELQMIDSHTVLGVAYGHLDKMDSSDFHLAEALRLSSKFELHDKYLGILEERVEILAMAERFEDAFVVSEQVKVMQDSIRSLEVSELRVEMQEKFDTKQKEAQNQLLTSENENQRQLMLGILGALVACIALIWYVLMNQRRTKKLNARISAQSFELNRSNKTKDRLFSIIGHDLRGPITSFETSTAIIKSYLAKNELSKVHEIIEHTDQSAKRLKLLLDNLLNWSLSQQNELNIKIESLELRPIVEEVLDIYVETYEMKGISVSADLQDAEVLADYNTISTVLRNLLSNAIKFSPPNSEIKIVQTPSDGFIELVIEDKGVGIPEQSLNKLFSIDKGKVRKGTAKEQGSGLGLVLVKEFVALNNGEIKFTTEEGKGTKFYITLPKAG